LTKRELNEENVRAFPGHGNPRDEELTRLRKELADVKMERDILKKAVAIFSKPGDRNT
jgi:transposase